MGRFHWCR